jgi:hypothetical protein
LEAKEAQETYFSIIVIMLVPIVCFPELALAKKNPEKDTSLKIADLFCGEGFKKHVPLILTGVLGCMEEIGAEINGEYKPLYLKSRDFFPWHQILRGKFSPEILNMNGKIYYSKKQKKSETSLKQFNENVSRFLFKQN